jgi:RNA polymerase sigma-70 factor (ECF subfamily)
MDEPETTAERMNGAPAPTEHDGAHAKLTGRALAVAFSDFYRGFMPRLVAFLRWQGVPLTDAVDLAQETMTDAYRQWETISHPQAWARRVASRRWARVLADGESEDPVADFPDNASLLMVTDVEEWEQRHDVLRVLSQLPGRQRQVLAWTLDGHTPSEIAAELRMTSEAVRGSLKLARRRVAELLREGYR